MKGAIVAKDKGKKKDKAEKSSSAAPNGLMAPGSGGQFKAEDHVDELLLITPKSIEEDIVTSNGTATATRADIVVLKAKGEPKVIDEALIFQKVVQGQLREALSARSRVVGRLFIDEASKKKGQNAPYKLAAPTEKDIKVATAYLDSLDPLR